MSQAEGTANGKARGGEELGMTEEQRKACVLGAVGDRYRGQQGQGGCEEDFGCH